jgi:hypothetical protein
MALCRSPGDTPQLLSPLIPGAKNLSKRDCSAGQFSTDRPAQEPVPVEDADLNQIILKVTRICFTRAVRITTEYQIQDFDVVSIGLETRCPVGAKHSVKI